MRFTWPVLAAGVLLGLSSLVATGQTPDTPPTKQPSVYDTTANARVQIDAALARAKRDNQRVLVMYGGNWCGWCIKLHHLLTTDKTLARTMLYEYQWVLVDIGRFDRNVDIAAGYGADLKKNGVPFLTVLDADGKVLANQETGALEKGPQHDPEKVAAFLNKWKATPLDAGKVVTDALARAKADDKRIFLHFGAPWCRYCRLLEEFLAVPDVARLLAEDYIDLKVDLDRMTGANEIVTRFRDQLGAGIPWIAILDAEGKVLVTADGPDGNIGYPVTPEEIKHFLDMLKQTARRLSADGQRKIGEMLEAAARKLRRPAP
jgi:thiol:disulfide interchange protein